MASTEAAGDVQVQPLARLDGVALPMLDDLVVQSGWNQSADDWGVFARHGHIGVVREASQRIVASGAVLPMGAALHGGSVAWISMILVSPGERGRGLGRAVFAHCLETAQAAGHVPMLDATPAGEPLYLQFGFAPLWAITRWRRPAKQAVAAPAAHDPPALGVLIDLDAQALGFRRPGLLAELAGRADARCVRVDGAVGVVRAGRVAHQIGPVLATDDASACALVQRLADAIGDPIMIDVPDDRGALGRALTAAGFERQRSFTRMALVTAGRLLPQGDSTRIHAIAGPEFA